uniref:Uncharacterized protein LOC100185653 n=1 Tax=Phallusia mammillata TaxID=59560 RepID=A0A6F9DIY3_9ASCI|nr:uncharacterized protein LOC100185653 [Phallusia mammillata]
MAVAAETSVIRNAVNQAIKGLFIGDSVAMPVHWYYDVPAIKRDFGGWIYKYEAPKNDHPTSILRVSNKGGSGRDDGSQAPSVIGTVILHDKLRAWSEESKHTHYHQGMEAGDNTLNCHCALQIMRTLQNCTGKGYNDAEVMKQVFTDYVDFMTTPESHNDTYAESWHRMLFADWVVAGKPTDKDELYSFLTKRSEVIYKQPPDKQLVVIGGFVVPTPIILHYIDRPLAEVIKVAELFLRCTHPVSGILEPFYLYIGILHAVVRGASLRDEAEKALLEVLGPTGKAMIKKFDSIVQESNDRLEAFQNIAQQLGIACYIDSSFAVLLYIVRHFHDDFVGGILTNVNIGGENCHRGSVVATLLGASIGSKGKTIPDEWTTGLKLNDSVDKLIFK